MSSNDEDSNAASTSSGNTDSGGGGSDRKLRKRKLDLNRLSSGLTTPIVCRFQYCGIQLRDGDSLDIHYQGHLSQELDKLDKVRVKKSSIPFEDWERPKQVRKNALNKIKFRREARSALPLTSRRLGDNSEAEEAEIKFKCPVCDIKVLNNEFNEHFDKCLMEETAKAKTRFKNDKKSSMHSDYDFLISSDDERAPSEGYDDDDEGGGGAFEEYTWAGQTRIRATALVDGDFAENSGFSKIIKGNEDEELDIESYEDLQKAGPSQYSEADVILPEADSVEEEKEREDIRTALGVVSDKKTVNENNDDDDDDQSIVDIESTEMDDLKREVKELISENEELKRKTMCNVCMDSYNKPLVSLECWHVHCEECWMRALGAKKLCPQCKVIIRPVDLRRIYL